MRATKFFQLMLTCLIAMWVSSCVTGRATDNLSQSPDQANAVESQVAIAAINQGQRVAPSQYDAMPRDGFTQYVWSNGVIRNPDNSVYLDPVSNRPIPITSGARHSWNLTQNLGNLSSAEISVGTVAQGEAWRGPAWEGLIIKGNGDKAGTTGDPDSIIARGEAEALAKRAAGDAAAQYLKTHYEGKVAVMKNGTDWIVALADGTVGVLDRVNPIAGATRAVEVVLKNGIKKTVKEPEAE